MIIFSHRPSNSCFLCKIKSNPLVTANSGKVTFQLRISGRISNMRIRKMGGPQVNRFQLHVFSCKKLMGQHFNARTLGSARFSADFKTKKLVTEVHAEQIESLQFGCRQRSETGIKTIFHQDGKAEENCSQLSLSREKFSDRNFY